MNTTDRSIGYVDYALRRRFAFITIKAQKEQIENCYKDNELKENAANLFDKISKIIPVICFHAGYNKDCENPNIIRCYSWYDIYSKINKLAKL